MTNKSELLARLQKIKTLSDKGVNGEKDAAKNLLEKLMKKYDVTEEELQNETEQIFQWFKYGSTKPLAKKMLGQVIFSVVGGRTVYSTGNKSKLGVDCTKAEAIEIEAKFKFYYASFEKDLDLFYTAFIYKNDLFPPDTVLQNNQKPAGRKDNTNTAQLFSMMQGLEKHNFYNQLS